MPAHAENRLFERCLPRDDRSVISKPEKPSHGRHGCPRTRLLLWGEKTDESKRKQDRCDGKKATNESIKEQDRYDGKKQPTKAVPRLTRGHANSPGGKAHTRDINPDLQSTPGTRILLFGCQIRTKCPILHAK
jgi:hypothetical protein